MKKREAIIFLVVLIGLAILSTRELTGYIVKERGKCLDSDKTSFYLYKGDLSFNIKGKTFYENRGKVYTDYCARGAKLKEYYCTHGDVLRSERISCVNGCADGACIK